MFNQQKQLSEFPHPQDLSSIESYETITPLKNRCDCIQAVILGSRNTYLLTKKNLKHGANYIHRLFACDIEIVENTVVFYLSKSVDGELTKMSVTILTCNANNKYTRIYLLANNKERPLQNESFLEVNPSTASDVYDSVKRRYLKLVEGEQWILRLVVENTVFGFSILEIISFFKIYMIFNFPKWKNIIPATLRLSPPWDVETEKND